MDSKPTHDQHDVGEGIVIVDGKAFMSPDERDPKWSPTLYVGGVGVLLLILSFVGLQAMYRAFERSETSTKVVNQSSRELEALERAQNERLIGYRVIDVEKKRVAIPIERAMTIVTKELKSR